MTGTWWVLRTVADPADTGTVSEVGYGTHGEANWQARRLADQVGGVYQVKAPRGQQIVATYGRTEQAHV